MPRQARPWFRFYSEAVNNRKLQRLDPTLFKLYINLLCIANQADPRGQLPHTPEIAFLLRTDIEALREQLAELHRLKFIEGPWRQYRIHDWQEWQPESDVNGTPGRQRRHAVGTRKERATPAVGTPREEKRRAERSNNVPTEKEEEAEEEEEDVVPVLPLPKFVERTWGRMVTGIEAKMLFEHADDYGDECVRHCVEEAALSNVKTVKYVEGICKRHKAEGCYEQRGRDRRNGSTAIESTAESGDPLGITKPRTFIENPYGDGKVPGVDAGASEGGEHKTASS